MITRKMMALANNLRHRIETGPHALGLIDTVIGAGYRLGVTRDRTGEPATAGSG